jgi:CHAT domain-containing protein
MVDHAICAERAGDFATSRQELRRALAEEPRHHLPQLRLSTISMQAALLHDAGETLASWQQDVTALALCSRTDCSAVRRYSFFYDLVRSAQDLQLPRVAEALMHTAVGLAEQTHDAVTRAYAWETLGRVAGKAQDFSMAAQAFDHARQVAHQDNQAALGALYQAEWKADEAEILELQQKPDAAESLLRQSAATLLASDYVPGRIKFYQQASIAALTLGHRAEALEDALAAVRESERALDKLGSADARAQWTREKAPIYGQFVQASLSQGGAQQGFEAWERFRRAPFVHDAALSLPASPTGAAATPHRTVLVLALTGGTYHGWLVDGDSLHVLRSVALGDRRTIQQQVVAFYRLCADRDSNLSDLRALGRKLYTALLAPLAVTGAGAAERLDHLRVDLDPSLAVLPLGALTLPNGRWLSDAYEVTVLPPWWTLTPATALSDAAIASDARALVVDGFDNASDRSESAEIVKLLHGATLVEGSSASPAKVLASLAESDTFHFAGHSSDGSTSLLMSSQAPEELLSPAQVEHAHLARCRVAILAACNTTAADPDQMEKLPDLRDALLQAGVANVIASSWDVDDASTRALMVALYRQLASHIPIAHALRAAEAAVHSENRWQHPFYWAPFEHFTH